MRKYYRNRFILGAMLSFLILLVLTVTGIWFVNYHQMERDTDKFIERMLSAEAKDGQPAAQSALPAMFGYNPSQRRYPSGFYDIIMDAEGAIQSIEQRGIIEEANVSVQQALRQAVAEKSERGKIGSYKYGVTYQEDGTARAILLDISIQLSGIYNTLKSALLVGALLLAVLFLILLPVSARVAGAFVRNSEKQKQFITDAGHDLKTPVAIIRSSLDVMDLLQGKSKWSENIRHQTERLERLIAQLLLMARLDETGVAAHREELDLALLIREEAEHYLPGLEQRGIAWKADLPETLRMSGDPVSLRNMLNLLLDNAAVFHGRGEVCLQAAQEKKKIHLTLSNTVESLPELPPEELTGRFVRGNAARTENGGSGIGLSAAKRIAEMHHGSLTISYQGENVFRVSVVL